MLEFDLNKMLFNIPKDMHNKEELTKILKIKRRKSLMNWGLI